MRTNALLLIVIILLGIQLFDSLARAETLRRQRDDWQRMATEWRDMALAFQRVAQEWEKRSTLDTPVNSPHTAS